MLRAIVIGAGVAGLSAAYRLEQAGVEVLCVEGSDSPGGVARTDFVHGFRCARGPETFRDTGEGPLRSLLQELGLEGAIEEPRAAARKRFVLKGGWPRPVPRGLLGLIGVSGIARLLYEPRVRARSAEAGGEAVFDFARRRFGSRAARWLFDPLIKGIYAGDPGLLSIAAAFPLLAGFEREHGSVLRGAMRARGPRRLIGTLRGGWGTLSDRLASKLSGGLRLRTRAVSIARTNAGFAVTVASSSGTETLACARLIVTVAAPEAARLLQPLCPDLAYDLEATPYAPVASVYLGFHDRAFRDRPPEGFGVLVPQLERRRMLGCLYVSSCFPEAAPEGHTLLRVMFGGRRDPEAVGLDAETLAALCLGELAPIVKLRLPARPVMVHVVRHRLGLPQYELGHLARVRSIEERVAALPGLELAGNAYRGVSVPDVIADGARAAARLAGSL
ncbi:MAG: protoporphyrinogen oxidase [Planctomycetota bacterium]